MLAELPTHVAQAVTDAVEEFARAQSTPSVPVEAVSWYHDEPIWFVESVVNISPSVKAIRRVQVAAFEPPSPRELPKLYLLPDAYQFEQTDPNQPPSNYKQLPDPSWVSGNARTVDIYDSKGNPYPYDQIRRNLDDVLYSAWNLAIRFR